MLHFELAGARDDARRWAGACIADSSDTVCVQLNTFKHTPTAYVCRCTLLCVETVQMRHYRDTLRRCSSALSSLREENNRLSRREHRNNQRLTSTASHIVVLPIVVVGAASSLIFSNRTPISKRSLESVRLHQGKRGTVVRSCSSSDMTACSRFYVALDQQRRELRCRKLPNSSGRPSLRASPRPIPAGRIEGQRKI